MKYPKELIELLQELTPIEKDLIILEYYNDDRRRLEPQGAVNKLRIHRATLKVKNKGK